jgi:hypothetical protein
MEDWKLIDEFPNYDVSSLGNIRNNTTGKPLKLGVKSGYYHISLVNKNIKKIHSLLYDYKPNEALLNQVKVLDFKINKIISNN